MAKKRLAQRPSGWVISLLVALSRRDSPPRALLPSRSEHTEQHCRNQRQCRRDRRAHIHALSLHFRRPDTRWQLASSALRACSDRPAELGVPCARKITRYARSSCFTSALYDEWVLVSALDGSSGTSTPVGSGVCRVKKFWRRL